MKISRRKLYKLIHESIKESFDITKAADVGRSLKQQWGEKTDKDPSVRQLMADLWKNTSVSPEQADPDSKEFVGDPKITDDWPWSAATISTMFADDPDFKSHRSGVGKGSAAHSDYMNAAYENRKKWDAGEETSGSAYNYPGYVAFKPEEVESDDFGLGDMTGYIACAPREGAGNGWDKIGKTNHCDVCLDKDCSQVVGGNIGDKLTIRSRPKNISMYIGKRTQEERKLD